ncbi:MAG: hypothetical protein HKN20_16165 [Gemmatimonadetes bacterium]|nr:hypothetical protein [Gemmatimonadota bacterium]
MRKRADSRVPIAIIAWSVIALVAFSCSNDPGDAAQTQDLSLSWVGEMLVPGKQEAGSLSIHVDGTGTRVDGRIVLEIDEGPVRDFWMRGTVDSDRVFLELNTDLLAYGYSLSIDAAQDPFGRLTGSIVSEGLAIDAEIDCRAIERIALTPLRSRELNRSASVLAFDGTDLWSASSGKYLRLNREGDVLEELGVFLRDEILWTSTALTLDDSLFRGHLPLSVSGDGEVQNLSDVISFTRDGAVISQDRMDHRTSGLGASGGALWSLGSEGRKLHRIDAGVTLQTVDYSVPGLIYLAFDGDSFWSQSWFDSRIYRIDGGGEVLGVYEMTVQDHGFPAGIACGDGRIWVLMSDPFQGRSTFYELETAID